MRGLQSFRRRPAGAGCFALVARLPRLLLAGARLARAEDPQPAPPEPRDTAAPPGGPGAEVPNADPESTSPATGRGAIKLPGVELQILLDFDRTSDGDLDRDDGHPDAGREGASPLRHRDQRRPRRLRHLRRARQSACSRDAHGQADRGRLHAERADVSVRHRPRGAAEAEATPGAQAAVPVQGRGRHLPGRATSPSPARSRFPRGKDHSPPRSSSPEAARRTVTRRSSATSRSRSSPTSSPAPGSSSCAWTTAAWAEPPARAPTITTEDFAGDAMAGVAFLRTRPEVDRKKIGLIGHSEGGIIAPMVASRSKDVAFIVHAGRHAACPAARRPPQAERAGLPRRGNERGRSCRPSWRRCASCSTSSAPAPTPPPSAPSSTRPCPRRSRRRADSDKAGIEATGQEHPGPAGRHDLALVPLLHHLRPAARAAEGQGAGPGPERRARPASAARPEPPRNREGAAGGEEQGLHREGDARAEPPLAAGARPAPSPSTPTDRDHHGPVGAGDGSRLDRASASRRTEVDAPHLAPFERGHSARKGGTAVASPGVAACFSLGP